MPSPRRAYGLDQPGFRDFRTFDRPWQHPCSLPGRDVGRLSSPAGSRRTVLGTRNVADRSNDDHAGHDHGEFDPHAWLSTNNAKVWLNEIAAKLSTIDPDNAGTYFANANEAKAEIDNLNIEINQTLDPVRGGKFVVFHDAYQYFETTFEFPASGAISLGDASDPSAARIAEIAERIEKENIGCVLSEPQFNAGLVQTVMGNTKATTEVIDPLGFGIEPGPELYNKLIRTNKAIKHKIEA